MEISKRGACRQGLRYLTVKGFTAVPLIPGVRASVPHLRIGNKLLLTVSQLRNLWSCSGTETVSVRARHLAQ